MVEQDKVFVVTTDSYVYAYLKTSQDVWYRGVIAGHVNKYETGEGTSVAESLMSLYNDDTEAIESVADVASRAVCG